MPRAIRNASAFLVISALLYAASCDQLPWSARSKAHEAVRAQLYDGDSAKFRDEEDMGQGHVCGFVNAKNRMGGYVGFTPYIFLANSGTSKDLVLVSPGEPDFSEYFKYEDNVYIRKDELEKITNACVFVVAWQAYCSDAKKAVLSSSIENCKLWTSGDSGIAKLRQQLTGN